MLWVNFISGFNFPLFQTHYTLPYPKTKEKKHQMEDKTEPEHIKLKIGDCSRVGLC